MFSQRLCDSLRELRESKDYREASLGDSFLLEDFTMLSEWVSLNTDDLYHYIKTGNSWYEFKDKNNITHEIRIFKNNDGQYEMKLWWKKDNNQPNYSPPNYYNNLKYDTRIFNTHIFILLNELLPYLFKHLPKESVFIKATDKLRYRLYKITLNNHLDKTKYELTDIGNNTLTVSLKNQSPIDIDQTNVDECKCRLSLGSKDKNVWTILNKNIVCADALNPKHSGWREIGYMWSGKKQIEITDFI